MHREICEEINGLYARKNHDYGDSFHQTFVEEGMAMARNYEMPDDYTWLCKEELKKIGVDVEAWNRERGSIHDIREQ